MKREFVALAVILAILTGSILNARYVERKTTELSHELHVAQQLYDSGAREEASSKVADSLKGWLKWKSYAHIMLRHNEVDNVTEAYFDLMADIDDEEVNVPPAAFGKVEQLLKNVSDMEQLSIGAIL